MSVEIERKFLVEGDAWRKSTTQSIHLRDGLIALTNGRKVRVRIFPDGATLTVKGRRKKASRAEYEYAIPHDDALEMLTEHCGGNVVEKTRHLVPHGAEQWVVDVYHGLLDGIVLAEIELQSVGEPFERPLWLGREVTGDESFSKVNMVKARRKAAKLRK